jgi:cytidylate kinase
MKVITISRYLYSGGMTIGQKVADELGYSFVTKETIEKIMDQYGMVDFDKVYESAPGLLDRVDPIQEDMIHFLGKLMQAIALHGSIVLLGRGSFSFFPDYSDVLNVRLWAPVEVRVGRLMERTNNTSWRICMNEVTEHDNSRKAFVERWLHGHPDQANAFDLVINTGKVPLDSAVRIIVDTARESRDLVMDNHKTVKSLEVDSLLLETVNEVLGKLDRVR